jgi:hypothetical protein
MTEGTYTIELCPPGGLVREVQRISEEMKDRS